ncbi:MAG: RnfABCDGE type electron transport complex subunit D [Planctomycetota bacterium]
MTERDPELRLHTAPFLKREVTTPGLMTDVIVALLPVLLASTWFFGLSAVLILASSVAGAMVTERFFGTRRGSLGDRSALLTGLLLGFTLPPTVPLWIAFLGSVAGVGLGKVVWGGLGHNLFNPALVGRAFLQAAFPTALTTWAAPGGGTKLLSVYASNLALPFMRPTADAVTTATPLALMKFEHQVTDFLQLFGGNIAGSLGETSGLLILLGGLYLLLRRSFDWRIPASILLTVAIFSGILWATNTQTYPTPWFMVASGGLLFGAIYMATDPVTSPLAPKGAWLFGLGIGVLVVLIRMFGALPEGVMYAILLMNAATPLIERVTQSTPFGR